MIKASGLRTDFICRRLFSESFSLRHDLKIPGSVG